MTRLLPLALLLPAVLGGCASQQTLDQQTAAAREMETLKQRVAQLAAAQANTDTRLGALESRQALLANRLDAATPNPSALDTLRTDLARLDTARQADAAALAVVREQAEDAVKIARDSRLVSGKLVDELILNESMVLFGYEQPGLTASGRAALDALIAQIRPRLPHVFVEIIGYTDNLGLGSQNRHIALERAESVRRYLHETGGIPLDRQSTISYGDLQPLASNITQEGRGQNRRVWVRVLK